MHLNSQKHIKLCNCNDLNMLEHIIRIYKCDICKKEINSRSTYYKHIKVCRDQSKKIKGNKKIKEDNVLEEKSMPIKNDSSQIVDKSILVMFFNTINNMADTIKSSNSTALANANLALSAITNKSTEVDYGSINLDTFQNKPNKLNKPKTN